MGLGAALGALLVCLVVAAPSEAAESYAAGSHLPAGGPALSSQGVGWAQYRRDGGYALRLARGAAVTTLRTRPNRKRRWFFRLQLAGSDQGLLSKELFIKRRDGSLDRSPNEVYGSFLTRSGGQVERLGARCQNGSRPPSTDGDGAMAVTDSTCPGQAPGQAAVLRLAPAGATTVRSFAGGLNTRIAGPYVAYDARGKDIVVLDWTTGVERYRLPIPGPFPENSFDLDVQADGKVAFAYDTGPRMAVAWASPSEPFAHPVDLPARSSYAIKLVGDRIAFARTSVVSFGILGEVGDALGEAGVSDLRGPGRVVARRVLTEALDFDGRRLALVEAGCRGPRIAVRGSDEPPAAPRSCPLLLARPIRQDRRGRLAVAVSCRGLTRGCGVARLRIAARRGKRLVTLASARYRSNPTTVRLRLRRGASALLARRRGRVVVSARLVDDELAHTELRRTRTRVRLR